MSCLTSPSKRELEAKVFGLAMACPCDQGNPIDCPLYQIRKMSLRERHGWAHGLSETAMEALLDYHEKCSTGKMNCPVDAAH